MTFKNTLNILPLIIYRVNSSCQSYEASKLSHDFSWALCCVYQLPQLWFHSIFLPQDSLQKPGFRNDCQVYFYRFLKFTSRTVLQLQEKVKDEDNERIRLCSTNPLFSSLQTIFGRKISPAKLVIHQKRKVHL